MNCEAGFGGPESAGAERPHRSSKAHLNLIRNTTTSKGTYLLIDPETGFRVAPQSGFSRHEARSVGNQRAVVEEKRNMTDGRRGVIKKGWCEE